jgi:protein polybromo-1
LPNIQRLIKHVRDVHAIKGIGKIVNPNDRSKNYMASTRKHLNIHLNQPAPSTSNFNLSQQPVLTTPISTGSPQIIYGGQQQQQNVVTCKGIMGFFRLVGE